MLHDPITYDLTDADRRELAVSFGIDLSKVQHCVTGGELVNDNTGVMFREMIGGHRIALYIAGKPGLAAAARTALAQVRKAA